ncbi:MAG: hypothetical protein L0Z46_06475 [Nitrospiraceae bacterium]|nr:hypothetical protein [Nitrospiraceae bacterium]
MERICREVEAAGTVLLVDASYIPANEPKAEGLPDCSRATSSFHLRRRNATGRDSGHAKTFMFNEIVKGSQDVGVVLDDSRRPDEQFGDSSAALHEIRRQDDLELET